MPIMQHRIKKILLISLLLSVMFFPAHTAQAQTGGITLTVNGCDSANYPDIVCTVTPVNNAGNPLQNLDATSFQVVDGSTTIPDIQVNRVVSQTIKASVLILVDFGMISQGQTLQPLKDSSISILKATNNEDRLAVIAITGPVNVDTILNPQTEYGFAAASEKRNDMISLINKLNAVGHTPLYDSVCRALMFAAQEKVGRRAVFVISDGADVGSTSCTDSDSIARANKDRTPVFTIGVGPDLKEGYLRKLALETGGQYESATQLQNVLDSFKRMEGNLRTQYQVTFHLQAPGDGKPKTVDIRVSQGGNSATDKATFVTAEPIKPTFSKVTFTVDGAVVNPKLLPANKTIILEPKIDSTKPVKAVEYTVNGVTTKETTPPFQFVVAANDLIGVSKITLKAAGEEGNPASVTTYDVQVAIDPDTLVSAPTPTPKPTLLQQLSTFPGILIVIVFIGLIVLLVLLFILLSRRKGPQSAPYIPESPPTMVTPAVSYPDSSAPHSTSGQVYFPTQMFSNQPDQSPAEPAVGAHTMMFSAPVAMLEITTGDGAGKRFEIGSTGNDNLTVGREPDSGPGAVRVASQFVSRKHARISVEGGVIYLTDLNSSSGTRLNGEKLIPAQRRAIKAGDKIEFADIGAEIKSV
ncbi:MAG TPA: FHA domain-containing protein [Anaerolineae bacterium]